MMNNTQYNEDDVPEQIPTPESKPVYKFNEATFKDFKNIVANEVGEITKSLRERVEKAEGAEKQYLRDLEGKITRKIVYLRTRFEQADTDFLSAGGVEESALAQATAEENEEAFNRFKDLLEEATESESETITQEAPIIDQVSDEIEMEPETPNTPDVPANIESINPEFLTVINALKEQIALLNSKIDALKPVQEPAQESTDFFAQQLAQSNEDSRRLETSNIPGTMDPLTQSLVETNKKENKPMSTEEVKNLVQRILARKDQLPTELKAKLDRALEINFNKDTNRYPERNAILKELAEYQAPVVENELIPTSDFWDKTDEDVEDKSEQPDLVVAPENVVADDFDEFLQTYEDEGEKLPNYALSPEIVQANREALAQFKNAFRSKGTNKSIESILGKDLKTMRDYETLLNYGIFAYPTETFKNRLGQMWAKIVKEVSADSARKEAESKMKYGDLSYKPQSDYSYGQPGSLPQKAAEPQKRRGLFSRI